MQYNDLAQALANVADCDRLFLDLKEGDAIPPEVGKLTNLADLYVTGKNNVPYRIPPEVVALPALRILTPGGTYKTFPPEILAMQHLEEVRFSYTCKELEFPEELTRHARLRKLDLSGIELDSIPDAVTRMPGLRELVLERCAVRTLPDTLARLENLEKLQIDGHWETPWGAAPVLFRLPRLRELRVSQGLRGLRDDIAQLTELEVLRLSHNEIDRIPAALAKLTKLRELALREQKLTELPDAIGELASLEKLELYRNEIKVLPTTIRKLTKLSFLELNQNPIEKLPPEIGSLTALTKLEVEGTKITEVPPEIGNLVELTTLELDYSPITTLPPEIGKLAKLDVLSVQYTKTLASLPDSFGDLASLRCCWMRENKLRRLPDTVGKLGRLEVIALDKNQLTSVPDSLADCAKLRNLELTGNTFPKSAIASLQAIKNKVQATPGRYLSLEMPREGGSEPIVAPTTADPNPLAPEVVAQITRLGGKLGTELGPETKVLTLGKWPSPMMLRQWCRIEFPPNKTIGTFRGTVLKDYGPMTIQIPGGADLDEYECSHHAPYVCIGWQDTQTYLLVNLLDRDLANPTVYRLDSEDYNVKKPLSTRLKLSQLLGKLQAEGGAAP